MDICVGSKNPSKLRGVERAFSTLYGGVHVHDYSVEADLPPQPFGLNTTMDCAKIRALRALERNAVCTYGVGVEAGLFEIDGVFYDIQVAYVVDVNGRGSYGFSPAFRVPNRFVELIKKGVYRELEDAVNEFYGTRGIGDAGGFIKLLSRCVVLREDLVYYAVLMALIPFINADVY
ncbi:MAG: inosine/xanthosine triphosphatase [Ignisphaera sp.]|nr:inosine/xanthosine triphosphatase [Ignisphaera sp.]MCX8168552.1 inosine/xanthosine triphosphatase [Ignisphaera sp.]MDW8085138.1 inosine/xanthosine triphosphatase [Ignisphaera sp.]